MATDVLEGLPDPCKGRQRRTLEQTIELLQGTDRLLAVPERWVKGEWALDGAGNKVELSSPRAVRWCLAGGLVRVAGERGLRMQRRVKGGEEQLPPSLDLAFTVLGFAAGLVLWPVVAGLRLVVQEKPEGQPEKDVLELTLEWTDERAKLPKEEGGKSTTFELESFVVMSNDLKATQHEHILATLERAIRIAQHSLERRRRR